MTGHPTHNEWHVSYLRYKEQEKGKKRKLVYLVKT